MFLRVSFALLFSIGLGKGAPSPTETKLRSLVVPKVQLEDATFDEAISFIFKQARKVDPETDEAKKGFRLTMTSDPGKVAAKYTLDETDITVFDLLTKVTRRAGIDFFVDEEGAVVMHPKGKHPQKTAPPRSLPAELTEAQAAVLANLKKTIIPSIRFEDAIQYYCDLTYMEWKIDKRGKIVISPHFSE
jgi:hypothetical protein